MKIVFLEILMEIILWALKLLDGIVELFDLLCGVSQVKSGEDIISYVIFSSNVSRVFWGIFVISIFLVGVFGIFGCIKYLINSESSVSRIVGNMAIALIGSFAFLAICVMCILISTAVLGVISNVFYMDGKATFGENILRSCIVEYNFDYSGNEIHLDSVTVEKLFGSYSENVVGIPKDWNMDGMINPKSFLYLPALLGTFTLLFTMLICIIRLSKRVFEMASLYISMPLAISTYPLDDGARFKEWVRAFTGCILIAYGSIFSINVYVLVLPLISVIRVPSASDFVNVIFMLLMYVGGGLAITSCQKLFNKIFNVFEDGQDIKHMLMHTARIPVHLARSVTHLVREISHSVHRRNEFKAMQNERNNEDAHSDKQEDGSTYRDVDTYENLKNKYMRESDEEAIKKDLTKDNKEDK